MSETLKAYVLDKILDDEGNEGIIEAIVVSALNVDTYGKIVYGVSYSNKVSQCNGNFEGSSYFNVKMGYAKWITIQNIKRIIKSYKKQNGLTIYDVVKLKSNNQLGMIVKCGNIKKKLKSGIHLSTLIFLVKFSDDSTKDCRYNEIIKHNNKDNNNNTQKLNENTLSDNQANKDYQQNLEELLAEIDADKKMKMKAKKEIKTENHKPKTKSKKKRKKKKKKLVDPQPKKCSDNEMDTHSNKAVSLPLERNMDMNNDDNGHWKIQKNKKQRKKDLKIKLQHVHKNKSKRRASTPKTDTMIDHNNGTMTIDRDIKTDIHANEAKTESNEETNHDNGTMNQDNNEVTNDEIIRECDPEMKTLHVMETTNDNDDVLKRMERLEHMMMEQQKMMHNIKKQNELIIQLLQQQNKTNKANDNKKAPLNIIHNLPTKPLSTIYTYMLPSDLNSLGKVSHSLYNIQKTQLSTFNNPNIGYTPLSSPFNNIPFLWNNTNNNDFDPYLSSSKN